MLVYPMGIQIHDQVSILRSWSKVKLHRLVFLGFGLKELKIAPNIVKVGVDYYLPNAHLNLWSNFNFDKLVKSETPSCGFVRIWLKGAENSSKHRESWGALLSSKCASKIYYQILIPRKWSKAKLRLAVSPMLGLKGVKIAQNITKFGVHACPSNGHPNLWSNFNSEKLVRSETPSCIFTRVGWA